MIKKNILVISLLFFLNSCGFQPIYSKNNNVNFSIEQVDFTGDRELNNFIKTNLYQYKNSDNNKIFIEAKGEVTNYELNAEIVFLIKPTNKQIKISEKKIMESMADKFEENKYEKSIKQNFASSITFKLIQELIIN